MNPLIRTQVSLTKNDRKVIAQLAGRHAISWAEVIRRAVRDYARKEQAKQLEREATIKRLAGSLKNSPTWKGVDAVAWQRKLRHEKGI